MASRCAPLLLLAFAACTTLNRAGGPLHVEKGELLTVRQAGRTDSVPLRWRELHDAHMVLDIVAGDDALPSPLALAHASGHSTLQLRFPHDGGGVGAAILAGRTPLQADGATLEALWVPGAGFAWIHPVAQLKLEGPLSLHRWLEPVRRVHEDPAPDRDLIDDIAAPELRYRVARGVERVMRLNFGGDVPSTWELAAVQREREPVPDWQDRVQLALARGRVDLLERCSAVIRENAFGSRRGKHYYRVPMVHLLLASEVDGSARRWSWSGLTAVAPARPRYDTPPLPAGLPPVTLRLVTMHDVKFRHGPSPFTHGLLAVAGYVGALFIEYGLGWTPQRDGWAEWWDDWITGGRSKQYRRRNNRAP